VTMSTGLTFGTISSPYGLTAGILDGTQFSLLVAVVVLSTVVPTAIAERWSLPGPEEHPRDERDRAPVPEEEFVPRPGVSRAGSGAGPARA
jgi:hypothetical protein